MERRECSASGIRLILKGLFGGPDRDRTDDLFHAMEARSQLRHRPTRGRTSLFSAKGAAESMYRALLETDRVQRALRGTSCAPHRPARRKPPQLCVLLLSYDSPMNFLRRI